MYSRYCKIRDRKGLRDADISRQTGIAQATLSDWKHGKTVPKLPKLRAIADVLEVPIEAIIGGQDFDYDEESHTWITADIVEKPYIGKKAIKPKIVVKASIPGKIKTVKPRKMQALSDDEMEMISKFRSLKADEDREFILNMIRTYSMKGKK